jgi:hypothetical protein
MADEVNTNVEGGPKQPPGPMAVAPRGGRGRGGPVAAATIAAVAA